MTVQITCHLEDNDHFSEKRSTKEDSNTGRQKLKEETPSKKSEERGTAAVAVMSRKRVGRESQARFIISKAILPAAYSLIGLSLACLLPGPTMADSSNSRYREPSSSTVQDIPGRAPANFVPHYPLRSPNARPRGKRENGKIGRGEKKQNDLGKKIIRRR
ncbi:PREDICTED: uncharacterized protein LOC105456192 [Wasmannia auropunctata]|uniref:uncharacterized protein LOC105456192 n=1 Tax=Wasmannia auropunctata TaxID=64793 RepID=UPI0005ED89B3|nr:PREDICTED: uncharacterized protein LOC105456192 [Wasmannia auropunctata]XP_011698352.1 PREDICTED: uncharacterized protein LOC105456192 [Wasmannia auropunctata]XP_011698353.1 PREDICTED: uncharacterized protein LOC105456192 [Wasmannia auropunctata]XP_011698354.1 PREDICTED: uncharacterized protein LOC105456192 [Wasmannia auropunctata]